jgi:hypothetical protein
MRRAVASLLLRRDTVLFEMNSSTWKSGEFVLWIAVDQSVVKMIWIVSVSLVAFVPNFLSWLLWKRMSHIRLAFGRSASAVLISARIFSWNFLFSSTVQWRIHCLWFVQLFFSERSQCTCTNCTFISTYNNRVWCAYICTYVSMNVCEWVVQEDVYMSVSPWLCMHACIYVCIVTFFSDS